MGGLGLGLGLACESKLPHHPLLRPMHPSLLQALFAHSGAGAAPQVACMLLNILA